MIKCINYIVESKSKLFESDWLCCRSFHAQADAVDFITKNEIADHSFRIVRQTVTEELIPCYE
jgi:hypothetical protein